MENPLENAKKIAAYTAVDKYVQVKFDSVLGKRARLSERLCIFWRPGTVIFQNNNVVGIGSGSTVIYAVHRLGNNYTHFFSLFIIQLHDRM